MVAQQVLVLFVQVRILVVQRTKAPAFLANAGVFVCIGAESSLPLHFDTLTWPMRENRLFRPSARLARKNGSGMPQSPAWQEDSEILTFERAEKVAPGGGKHPLPASQKALWRSRLPFREAVTRFPGAPHKHSGCSAQAICADGASIAGRRNKHCRRTELARWPLRTRRRRLSGLCFALSEERPCQPKLPFAGILQAFCGYFEQTANPFPLLWVVVGVLWCPLPRPEMDAYAWRRLRYERKFARRKSLFGLYSYICYIRDRFA